MDGCRVVKPLNANWWSCKLPFFPAHWGLEFSSFFSNQKGNGLDLFQRRYKAQRLVRS